LDRVIEAGKSEQIEIQIPASTGGRFVKAVTGQSNDSEHRDVRFECVVQAKAAMQLSSPNINFGEVKRNAGTTTKTLTLTRGDGGPIHPVLVSTGNDQVKAEIREIEPGQKYELEVQATPPWPNNMLRGNLAVDTGVTESPRENIVVFGQIAPRLAARPNRFTIPLNVSSELTLRTQLVWSDDKPGKVLSVSVNNAELQAALEDQPGGQQSVALRVPPGFRAPAGMRDVVTVRTDDPEVPSLQINIFGMQAVGSPTPAQTGTTQTPRPPLRPTPAQPPAPPAAPPQPR
jgi:uncharacterized membrane protein